MIFIYNILFISLVFFASPLWIILLLKEKKWLEIFFQRAWITIPKGVEGFKSGIWVHTLSVGETLSAEPMIRKISERTKRPVIVSVSTLTGYETAKRLYEGRNVLVVFFPFDFIWTVKRALTVLSPSLIIIVENDVWPNFIWLSKKKDIDLAWANARVSDRSYPRYFALRRIAGPLLDLFDLVLSQTSEDKKRLSRIGIGQEKIIRTGNLKFDRDYTIGIPLGLSRKKLFFVEEDLPLFVAGSTHPGEETILLDVFEKVSNVFPETRFVIAPRNPERAEEVARIFAEKGHDTSLFSKVEEKAASRIIIIDCLGRLLEIYSVSDAAFIGGSFLPYGGHNPLEPASFSKPVFFGPYMNDFKEISDNLVSARGATMVSSSEELSLRLIGLFSDESLKKEMGKMAEDAYRTERGVSDLCMNALSGRFFDIFTRSVVKEPD